MRYHYRRNSAQGHSGLSHPSISGHERESEDPSAIASNARLREKTPRGCGYSNGTESIRKRKTTGES